MAWADIRSRLSLREDHQAPNKLKGLNTLYRNQTAVLGAPIFTQCGRPFENSYNFRPLLVGAGSQAVYAHLLPTELPGEPRCWCVRCPPLPLHRGGLRCSCDCTPMSSRALPLLTAAVRPSGTMSQRYPSVTLDRSNLILGLFARLPSHS